MSAVTQRLGRSLRPRGGAVEFAGLIGLIVLFVVLSFASSAFLTKQNMLDVLQANAETGIAACAGTLVIVAGGIDLSIGAIYGLAAVLSARLAISTGVEVGIAAAICAGAAAGLMNGLVVTVARVNPLVATLIGAIVIGGAAEVIANQELLTPEAASFLSLGRDSVVGVKDTIWIFAIVAIAFGVLLSRSRFGREAKVIGANEEVARLSGVAGARVRCLTYVFSGLAAALAGILAVSQSGQAQSSNGGIPFVISVVAAIAVGGTSLRGGDGAIWRTLVGVLFLGLVDNGLSLLNVNPLYFDVFTGFLILIAVGAESLGGRSPARGWR